jgi:Fe-S-cluster containining protein
MDLLQRYRLLLESIDAWFAGALTLYGDRMACARGCTGCCRGLFDITLLDGALLKSGFDRLPAAVRRPVLRKAEERLAELQGRWPDFGHPYLLNAMPDEEWTEMPEEDETPCPLLDGDGACLVYAFRPMTCRLHGLPNIDASGESFSDLWCTRNFTGGESPLTLTPLRWEFRRAFEEEMALFGEFTARRFGERRKELDTFIPTALLIDFASLTAADLPLLPGGISR